MSSVFISISLSTYICKACDIKILPFFPDFRQSPPQKGMAFPAGRSRQIPICMSADSGRYAQKLPAPESITGWLSSGVDNGTLPRAKKMSTGHFFTRPTGGPLSSSPLSTGFHKRKHPQGVLSFMGWIMGLSPELKKCPLDTFLPALRAGRSLRAHYPPDSIKEKHPQGVLSFLGWIMGLEPTIFRATI